MKKKLKIYLHHNYYEPVLYKKKTGVFNVLINAISSLCYGVGFALLQIILFPYQVIKTFLNLPNTNLNISQKIHDKKFQKAMAVFMILAVTAGASIHGLKLIAAGQNIKGQVLGASDIGLNYLKDAKVSLDEQNTDAAQVNFDKALEQFRNSKDTLNSTNVALRSLLAVVPQKHDAEAILSAAELITQVGIKGTQLIELTQNMKLSAIGLNSAGTNKDSLLQAQTLLNDSVTLANQAANEIDRVSIDSIPESYRPAFVSAKDMAKIFQNNVTSLKEICSLLFDLVLGQKNVLIVFQNNNELRATGGFMGTIGNAKLQDGALNSLDIRSVYDWDGQLKEKVLPPQPMYLVNNQWFLRDSNWFASFPESASRISAMFEKEGGETPDLIVAMTPEVVLDMLDRTGPITLPQHNITLTKENFVETTQIETSVNYDKEQNQPKQFLADFFPILMEKVGEKGGLMTFLEIFQDNLYKKNVLLFSRNPEIQRQILKFNWGGELRTTDRDYLSIVNSNLGGTKSDLDMQRSTDLETTITSNGEVINTLRYSVKNLNTQTALNNKSFIRFYVPEGSKLISSEGFTNDIILPRLPEQEYTQDENVQNWQKKVIQNTVSGTFTGSEAGKTWFGNWLDTPASQTKVITLKYKLPFTIKSIDRYSLLVQKQSGSTIEGFNYKINFGHRSSLWKSNTASVNGGELIFNQALMNDMFIGLVLEEK